MVAIAPLKTKISRLVQKCRDKDDLLRRLGAELRKLKKGGGPGPLLQELAMMEQRMSSEEYNMPEAEFLQQPNHSNRLSVSMIDLRGQGLTPPSVTAKISSPTVTRRW